MKLRTGLTIWIYISSLIALAVSAGHLSLALELYSPLSATHLGPRAPAFTQEIVRSAASYPIYLVAAGVVSLIAALYFWRSSRPKEEKTFAVTLIAAINLAFAAVVPPLLGSTPILRTLPLSPILGKRSVHVQAQALQPGVQARAG